MKTKFIVIVSVILMAIVGTIPVYAQSDYENVKAQVVEDKGVQEVEKEDGTTQKTQSTEVRILEGEYENEEYEMEYVLTDDVEGSIVANTELKEEDKILVDIQEEEGEVTNVSYKETTNQNYILYIVLAVSIILVLVIGRKKAIKPIILYIFTTVLVGYMLVLGMKKGWSLILISSISSLVITIVTLISVNKMSKKTIVMIVYAILGTAIAGIAMYLLFDIMNLSNVNIKIAENFISIKELFCSGAILFGTAFSNVIIVSALKIYSSMDKTYKTKSDNIIEGQRSLKL